MRQIIFVILASLMTWAGADNDDVQYVKSVKGGHGGGGFQYNAGYNLARFYGNNTQQGYGMRTNLTAPVDYEIGVCYIEVPTASLVKDPAHIPAGNGSRPDLSRIRTCCKGYIRNIHVYKICDPVCTHECVNALCTAPEVCTCFPDHIKNLAGYCVATCPIGCQNGQCAGGECICKDGYKLDSESKFCMPSCRENCGGIGNCTAPNKCECKNGYEATSEGNCKPICSQCTNGDCVAPNECRCRPGYTRDQRGLCIPHCPQGCGPSGQCVSPNVCNYPSTTTTARPLGFFVTNHPVPSNQHLYPFSNPPQTTSQPGFFNPNQPNPNQPGYPNPNQPSPNQPGYPNPNQPSQNQPAYFNPNQPAYFNPNQPLYPQSNQPLPPNQQQPSNDSSHQPTYYQQPNQPGNFPLYPGNQVVPQCSQTCINGFCVEGNRCSCNPGYVLDRADPTGTKCLPNCPGGCPNGVCSAPNFCICNMGYYKDHSVKGRPACVKRVRRSIVSEINSQTEVKEPINVAELLIFDIPEEF